MYKDVIFVEDGSVDVDELQESLTEETKVIVYRQNARKPEIEHLMAPIKTNSESDAILETFAEVKKLAAVLKNHVATFTFNVPKPIADDIIKLCQLVDNVKDITKD